VAPQASADQRALARSAGLARLSSLTMLVLGGASLVVSARSPWSAGFAVSGAVVANGLIERHWGRRLAAMDVRAPSRLALNQVAVGLEVLVYALWQAHTLDSAQIDGVLQRPMVASLLRAIDPQVLEGVLELLPAAVKIMYAMVGAGTLLGCLATAWYFGSQVRVLRRLQPQAPAG